MNALKMFSRRSMAQVAATQQLRSKSTMTARELLTKKNSFQKQWLSDPSTYPIMLIMGGGMCWMLGMGMNALFTYKDVQINPNNRGATLKDWSPDHRVSVMERYANAVGGVRTEGLGIDHDEWAKRKEEYRNE
jgi:hypothetical protein